MIELPIAIHVLFLFAVIWCLFWALAATRSRIVLAVMIALGVVHWILATRGVYTNTTTFPPPQGLLLAPAVVALVITLIMPAGRRWLASLDPLALVMLQVMREPVEVTLHQAYISGLVPQGMTYSGHNFDILSGISAAFMAAWMISKSPPGRAVQIAWNLGCLVLLFIVVITAVLSIPSSIQRLNFDHPNVLVTSAPYVLLPAVIVPAALWAHMASLVRLFAKDQR